MKVYYTAKNYVKQTLINKGSRIRFFNFWEFSSPKEVWFHQFITHRGLDRNYTNKINFYSVFGSIDGLKIRRKGIDVFFIGENLHTKRFDEYSYYCKHHSFDCTLGFDFLEADSYLRFPLWILYMFKPDSNYADIKHRVNELSLSKMHNKTKFCSLVASHDWNGIRGQIMDALSTEHKIDSAGKFRNNTDSLVTAYNNNKIEFIKNYKFNICPENSNNDGYVTEKIFESIAAGCIPIYWGSNNQPENGILNPNAILFWNHGGNNTSTIGAIDAIMSRESEYFEFLSRPRFTDNAPDLIWQYFEGLDQKLRSCFRNI